MEFFSCYDERTTLKKALRRRLDWEFFGSVDPEFYLCFNSLAVLFRVMNIMSVLSKIIIGRLKCKILQLQNFATRHLPCYED